MKLTIDTDAGVLTTETSGTIPLYSTEAFEIISRQWVRIGWGCNYYFTLNWFGRPILQLPDDLVRLQEAIYEVQPDVILECGIYQGGSLVFNAGLCEAMGKGRVIGIDIGISPDTREAIAKHRLAHRITMIEGDSIAPETVAKVRSAIRPDETVFAILDSHHSKEHVAGELAAYAPLVTPGSCIIAADGVMRDLTDVPGGDPAWSWDNPASAALEFAANHPEFEMRAPKAPRHITYWPDAWLWKKSRGESR